MELPAGWVWDSVPLRVGKTACGPWGRRSCGSLGNEGIRGKRVVTDRGVRREGQGSGYQGLIVWQRAMDLTEAVYDTTRAWPREELYGLTAQARRAAISVPSKIAEGHGRAGLKEYAHHASVAYGSLSELETQILIAQRLGYHSEADARGLLLRISEVRRLLRGLLENLRERSQSQ